VYEIALSVAACLRAGTRVDVAWLVSAQGLGSRWPGEAVAVTPGGGRMGALLSGALDGQIADLVAGGARRRLVDLHVGEVDAQLAGLPNGGDARGVLVPAEDLPHELWDRLRNREPVCLLVELDGDRVVRLAMVTSEAATDAGPEVAQLVAGGVSASTLTRDRATTVLWPVPRLVVVGASAVVDALVAMGGLLGWQVQISNEVGMATGLIAGLAGLDKVVVAAHDDELAGAALAAALASEVGYIGALGSRRTQRARADWLAYRDITDLSRVHGPAGLDIGAGTAAEVAVAVLAEAIASDFAARAERPAWAGLGPTDGEAKG
jgi:xanthine dehydrogenase accessory factor